MDNDNNDKDSGNAGGEDGINHIHNRSDDVSNVGGAGDRRRILASTDYADGKSSNDDESLLSASTSASSSSSILLDDDDSDSEKDSEDEDNQEDDQSESRRSQQQQRGLSLSERQARNLERNARFLADLHDKYKGKISETSASESQKKNRRSSSNTNDDDNEDLVYNDDDDNDNGGMEMKSSFRLFTSFPERTTTDTASEEAGNCIKAKNDSLYRKFLIDELHERYPHRSVEIRQLLAILNSSSNVAVALRQEQQYHQHHAQVYVPAPIFCTGPKGCGKTSVVCDVVEVVQKVSAKSNTDVDTSGGVKAAYVDCSTVEPSTIERLVYDTYQQLRPKLKSSLSTRATKKRRAGTSTTTTAVKSRHHSLRKRQRQQTSDGPTVSSPSVEHRNENHSQRLTKQENHDEPSTKTRDLPSHNSSKYDQKQHQQQSSVTTSLLMPSSRRLRNMFDSGGLRGTTAARGQQPGHVDNRIKIKKKNSHDDDKDDKVETSHSAVMSLGRSLQQYYGRRDDDHSVRDHGWAGAGWKDLPQKSGNFGPNEGRRRRIRQSQALSAILILDKAEELLSLGSSTSSSSKGKKRAVGSSSASSTANKTTNYLAELLLLPKIMKLNLTIIVISAFATLEKTRLNNLVAPSRSLGTIANGIHPIVVQFPGYQATTSVFRDILTTDMNNRLVVGNTLRVIGEKYPSLKRKLIDSFWHAVIQFVSDTSRDVTDFIRVGRALWPTFVSPLHPTTIESTMQKVADRLKVDPVADVVRHHKLEEALTLLVSAQFYPKVNLLAGRDGNGLTLMALNEDGRVLDQVVANAPSDSSKEGRSSNHSFLRQCLILAAFVCQSNKADQDKKMFSVQANGKRRKRKATGDLYGGNDEDVAYGEASTGSGSVGQAEQLKSLRLRSFPLERVFSIFVSLVRFNPMKTELSGSINSLGEDVDDSLLTTMMGSQRLHDDIAHFIDSGKLHPTNYTGIVKGEQINLSSARFWCSVTREEAMSIADSINVPLEKYLV